MVRQICLALAAVLPLLARDPLASRIAHNDPSKYRSGPAHEGAGAMDYAPLFGASDLNANLQFVHRGIIPPKSGIGQHFHNQCEEMFVIFDGEAQFTIDGHTSLLKGPAGAICRAGHSHAIYNATDKPVQWMNINVTLNKGRYDAFNLSDNRVGAPLDLIPQFMTMHPDKALLPKQDGVRTRRMLGPDVFVSNWSYMDHVVVPAGASTPRERHEGVEEVYYVMSGAGTVRVNAESAPIRAGDAVPVQFNDVHSFENTGSGDLEFLVIGVARVKYALDTQVVK
jgi:mannose-6-phosphate isomerase-like protein (cupin superfamily)